MTAWFDDLPLDFTRDETREAQRLLMLGFSTNFEALMLAQNVGLDLSRLPQMSPPVILIREILVQARVADRLVTLLGEVLSTPALEAVNQRLRMLVAGHEARITSAAVQRKPSIATLAALPPSVEVWRREDMRAGPAATGLEKIINAAAGFMEPAVFRRRLAEAEVRTARIDVGGKANGTGFLVGPRHVLTNWHVVRSVHNNGVAVFDSGEADGGRKVPFAPDWLIANSEHAAVPVELGPEGPPPGLFDYAVVELSQPVGDQTIGPDPTAAMGDKRRWYALDGTAYSFEAEEPLMILGHPSGRPVQFSWASPSEVTWTSHSSRLRYKTNTEGGSSGSPVFNRDWRIVALHHAAGPTTHPGEFNRPSNDFNQGVPMTDIVADLKKKLTDHPALAQLELT